MKEEQLLEMVALQSKFRFPTPVWLIIDQGFQDFQVTRFSRFSGDQVFGLRLFKISGASSSFPLLTTVVVQQKKVQG